MIKLRLRTAITIYATIIIVNISAVVFSAIFSERPFILFKEGGLITWLSSANIVMLAGISLCSLLVISFYQEFDSTTKGKFVFLFFCFFGYSFLAIDEWFLVHEKLDFMVHNIFNIEETSLTDRLDDIVVMLYGMCGIFVFWLFGRAFWDDKKIKRCLLIAIILFAVMVLVDIFGNDNYFYKYITDKVYLHDQIWLVLYVIEDSIKLLAETALIIAFLEIFQSLLRVIKLENFKTLKD